MIDFSSIEGFEWDDGNKLKNLDKHNVSNAESEEVFFNEPNIIIKDEKHSQKEDRFVIFGITNKGRKITIIFTIRNNKIRIISARDMNKREEKPYEEKRNKGNS